MPGSQTTTSRPGSKASVGAGASFPWAPVAATLTLPGVQGSAQQRGPMVHPMSQGGSRQQSSALPLTSDLRKTKAWPGSPGRSPVPVPGLSVSTSHLALPLSGSQ